MKHNRMSLSIIFAALAVGLLSCNAKEEKESSKPSDMEEVNEVVTFNVTLPDAPAGFKTTWSAGDRIQVYSVKGNFTSKEKMEAESVSPDGKTATFSSTGKLLSGAESYYAMLDNSGVKGFKLKRYWSSDNMDRSRDAVPSVTIGKCTPDNTSFTMKNIFSLMSFEVKDPATHYVTLAGNTAEVINKNVFVSFGAMEITDNPAPDFDQTPSIRCFTTSGTGTYYIGLYPGLEFSRGYTLTAYDADGNVIGKLISRAPLTVGKAELIEAGDIGEPVKPVPGFDESRIVASIAAISDTHVDGVNTVPGQKFRSALEQLKAKAAESDKDGIDGVMIVGDLINNAQNLQAQAFKQLYEQVFDPAKVPMVFTVGNHDMNPTYSWTELTVSQNKSFNNVLGSNYFKTDLDQNMRNTYEARHCMLAGYHILCLTPNNTNPITYPASVLEWFDKQMEALTREDPEKYVIVLTHPMVAGTIYGSMLGETDEYPWYSSLGHYWATHALDQILAKYPQAVTFHGHLHFPLNDPRTVWQGDFTSFGCASTRYMAIENGGYENMSSATVMNDSNDFSEGYLLQFDASGNMRAVRMDFYHSTTIGEPWEISYPAKDRSHLGKYSHTTRSALNSAPVLSELSVIKSGPSSTDITASFAAGSDDEFVHDYVLKLFKDGEEVSTKRILSDFYLHASTSEMKKTWTVDYGMLKSGNYSFSLTAYDSWGAESNTITKDFVSGVDYDAEEENLWKSDEAGSMAFGDPSTATGGDGWLTFADGRISWTANTTGAPRTAVLTFSSGSKVTITQIGPDDFKGDWIFRAKYFNSEGTGSSVEAKDVTVTIGNPLHGETLRDGSGNEHVNQLGVDGLYHAGLIADASVEIDYAAMTARFGLFLDARVAQKDPKPVNQASPYIAFLPETGNWNSSSGSFGGPYSFTTPDLGEPDYVWLWFDVSSNFNTLTYLPAKTQALDTTNPSKYNPHIIGITVASFKNPDATMGNAAAAGPDKYTNIIYQYNTNNVLSQGMTFKRK